MFEEAAPQEELLDRSEDVKIATVSVERGDAGAVVHVRGEIEFANSDEVRASLLATIPLDGTGLILDLTETTYLSSSGVRLLFEVAERLHGRDQRLVLVMTNEGMIRRVVALTKLDNLVPLVPTVDDALAALREA